MSRVISNFRSGSWQKLLMEACFYLRPADTHSQFLCTNSREYLTDTSHFQQKWMQQQPGRNQWSNYQTTIQSQDCRNIWKTVDATTNFHWLALHHCGLSDRITQWWPPYFHISWFLLVISSNSPIQIKVPIEVMNKRPWERLYWLTWHHIADHKQTRLKKLLPKKISI